MVFIIHLLKSILSMFGFKFCEYCGGFLRGDAKKCSDCGAIVREADVFSWGWCAIGAAFFPAGLCGAIFFFMKRKRERAKSALVGAIIQIVLLVIAVALLALNDWKLPL